MAPNLIGNTFLLAETAIEQEPPKRSQIVTPVPPPQRPPTTTAQKLTKKSLEVDESTAVTKKSNEYKVQIVWRNVTAFIILHLAAFYSIYLIVSRFIILEYILGK